MIQHQIIRESGGRKVFSIRDEELLFPKVYGKAMCLGVCWHLGQGSRQEPGI